MGSAAVRGGARPLALLDRLVEQFGVRWFLAREIEGGYVSDQLMVLVARGYVARRGLRHGDPRRVVVSTSSVYEYCVVGS